MAEAGKVDVDVNVDAADGEVALSFALESRL
jgi:hypothetical protein